MKNLALRITIRGSVIRNHLTPLDAMLCGMLYEQGMCGPDAALGGGLYDFWEGIPMASLPAPNDEHTSGIARIVQNNSNAISQQIMLGVQGTDAKAEHTRYHRKKHPNMLNTFPTLGQPDRDTELEYMVRGDFDAIKEVMLKSKFIGKKRNVGFGEIMDIDGYSSDDHEHFGITVIKNDIPELIRPVPIELCEKLGVFDPVRAYGRYCSPYTPQVCYQHGYEFSELGVPT